MHINLESTYFIRDKLDLEHPEKERCLSDVNTSLREALVTKQSVNTTSKLSRLLHYACLPPAKFAMTLKNSLPELLGRYVQKY